METNYQKLDFLAEIGATETLKKLLREVSEQSKLFGLKNVATLCNLLLDEKIFDNECFDRLLQLNDDKLIEKYIRTKRMRYPLNQCRLIKTGKSELIKLMLMRNNLDRSAQKALLELNNEELIHIYTENHYFDKELTVIFFKQATSAQMKRYIHLHNRSFETYRSLLEPYIFATNSLEVIAEYCANLSIANNECACTLLKPERTEILLAYLKRYALDDDPMVSMFSEIGNRTALEYLVFQKQLRITPKAFEQMLKFEDATKWVEKYISYTALPETYEVMLFEPAYRHFLLPYIKEHHLFSYEAQTKLFEEENKALLREVINKHALHEAIQLKLFELDDNNELLKFHIEKHGLSAAAERHMFRGNNKEMKLYYLAQTGQDK